MKQEQIYIGNAFMPCPGHQKLAISILLKLDRRWQLDDTETMGFIGRASTENYQQWRAFEKLNCPQENEDRLFPKVSKK
jgi:hypothetical protein